MRDFTHCHSGRHRLAAHIRDEMRKNSSMRIHLTAHDDAYFAINKVDGIRDRLE